MALRSFLISYILIIFSFFYILSSIFMNIVLK